MKLVAFRVQNYKKIQDTGWVEVADLTTLVGKNEAGKTALLRGLSKLKPTDGEKYNGVKEFPHGRYTDEFRKQDWPVASARYVPAPEELNELSALSSPLAETKTITVTRYFSGKLGIEYDPAPTIAQVSAAEWIAMMDKAKKSIEAAVAPDGKGEQWGPIKQNVVNHISGQLTPARSSSAPPAQGTVESLRSQILGQANEQWSKDALASVVMELDQMLERFKAMATLEAAAKWVEDKIPFFLYFGRYEILESSIYLPEFVNRVNANDRAYRTRVQHAMFKHVGVDVKELANLGRHQPGQAHDPNVRQQIDELTIKANSASIRMTEKFGNWWIQRNHKFSYEFNGDYFRIWVADDLDPAKVELEERSEGMRYFFSFYLLFIVEAQDLHRNCILLLDEPGLHLHGRAQEKLIDFLQRISEQNQTIYSTHSPFMIDGKHLEWCRAVYETPAGTKVSTDIWPKDRDTLFPLQAALDYSVCQALFISRKQVLVEGPTDYMLLHALNEQLGARGDAHLEEGIVMLPVGGAKNMAPLASLLAGHEIELVILQDSDKAAQVSEQKLRSILSGVDKQCLQARQFSSDPGVDELEDLIPDPYYLDAAPRAYPDIKLAFSDEEKKIRSVVDRVGHLFERLGKPKLDKRRPALVMVGDISGNSKNVPTELYDLGKRIFCEINKVFASSASKGGS